MRRRPHGKGANVTAAAQAAIAEYDDEATVLLCDADLGVSAGSLVPLLEAVEGGDCDLAVGRPATSEGGGFGVTLGYARRAVERRSGARLAAPLSGQRAVRLTTLRDLLPFADGWGIEVGMTIDAVRDGFRVMEIEVPFEHRITGRTPGGFFIAPASFETSAARARAR